MLSRQAMLDVITNGGSVLYQGRLITKTENLPSAATLARTDEEKAAAAEDIDAQLKKLTEQKAAVTSPTTEGRQLGASKEGAEEAAAGTGDKAKDLAAGKDAGDKTGESKK